MGRYANSVETIRELLNYISKLAKKQLEIKQKRINQYSWEMDLMMCDRYMHPGEYKKSDIHNRFVILLYTCKTHFTEGNSEHSSVSGKAFFNEFVKMLKEKKEFDYNNEKDWELVYTTAGGLTGWKMLLNKILIVNL